MSNEKMREEFEVWFDNKHKTDNESLNFAIREAMFDAWQASRAALCIELPDICFNAEDEPWFVQDVIDGSVKDALNAAGVRYK